MKLIQSNNDSVILFISGMFAGSWTWEKCRSGIVGNHFFIEEPLMGINNDVGKLVDIIARQVDELPTTMTVVGNSLGGYIALALAERLPEKVDQVLISGSAGFSKIHLDIKDCLSRNKAHILSNRLIDLICYDHSKATEKDRNRLAEDLITYLRNMLGLFRGCNQVEAADVLQRVTCPVKAFWGVHDIISPFADAKVALENNGVEYTLLEKCGHSPMFECPREFAAWVNQCVVEYQGLPQAA